MRRKIGGDYRALDLYGQIKNISLGEWGRATEETKCTLEERRSDLLLLYRRIPRRVQAQEVRDFVGAEGERDFGEEEEIRG